MRLPKPTIRWTVFWSLLLLVAAGILAPYLHADRFGDRIQQALERYLNRKVEIGEVRLNLFRGPGFSLRRVVIYDDPATGIEPFAYVNSIEARVRLSSLWSGRLDFSSLRLEEPSVNLVKAGEGPWNFQLLLGRAVAAPLPAVSVRGGRLNFKLGAVKSVFYFSNADLDVRPPRTAGGAFDLEFSGQPARTDRTARGFGTLRGRGRWRPGSGSGGNLELNVELEKSSMGELVALIHGHDVGVHGQAGGTARFRGPVSGLEVTGTLQVSDVHRWDLLPPYAQGGPLQFRGKLDLLSETIDVETLLSGESALAVRFRAFDYLTRPRWGVSVTLNQFPIPPLVDVARHMGAQLAEAIQMEGSLLGVISYSPDDGIRGDVSLNGASIKMPNAPAVRFEDAQLTLDGSRAKLSPALIRIGDRETARLEFDYGLDGQRLDLGLSTDGMSIAALQSEGGPLPGVPKPEFVSRLRDGAWQGSLRYHRDGNPPGQWSGAVEVRNSLVTVPGFAQPLELRAATVKFQGERITAERIDAAAGEMEIRGEYFTGPKPRARIALPAAFPNSRHPISKDCWRRRSAAPKDSSRGHYGCSASRCRTGWQDGACKGLSRSARFSWPGNRSSRSGSGFFGTGRNWTWLVSRRGWQAARPTATSRPTSAVLHPSTKSLEAWIRPPGKAASWMGTARSRRQEWGKISTGICAEKVFSGRRQSRWARTFACGPCPASGTCNGTGSNRACSLPIFV